MIDLDGFDLDVLLGEDTLSNAGQKAKEVLAEDHAGKWARVAIPLLGDRMLAAIDERLEGFDLLGVFAQGWSKSRELAAIPAGKRTHVRLGKHVVEQDLHPTLTFRLGHLTSDPLRFTLTLQAEIEAVELKIVDRHITRIGGGQFSLGALLKYGEQLLGGGKHLWRRDIPGDYKFAAPIRILGTG
jgi:hypothetical protein